MADDASLSLYDTDFYLWTQAQAEKLRARVGRDNELDYENLAEEVGDLGSEHRNKVMSYVRLILEHLYKLHATRRTQPVGHWIGEIINFRGDAEYPMTRTIQRLVQDDLESLHAKAAKAAALKFRRDEPGVLIDPSLRWTWAQIMGEGENDPIDKDFPLTDRDA
jgi:hypothetical protein